MTPRPPEIVDADKMSEWYRKRYEAGDLGALPAFLKRWFTLNVFWRALQQQERLVPDWAQQAFATAATRVEDFHVKSWDDVFGYPLEKGKHLGAERKRIELSAEVSVRLHALSKEGYAIDKRLFEKIGKEVGVSGTIASDIYYKSKKRESRGSVEPPRRMASKKSNSR